MGRWLADWLIAAALGAALGVLAMASIRWERAAAPAADETVSPTAPIDIGQPATLPVRSLLMKTRERPRDPGAN